MPTQEALRELFNYDPSSGLLTWRHCRKNTHAGHQAGDKAGPSPSVGINGKVYNLNRIVWVYLYGDIGEGLVVDHIDHDPQNNRPENLRLVTQHDNVMNTSQRRDNKSGHVGVCFVTRTRRWLAFIQYNGKMRHLGSFLTKEEAVAARQVAQIQLPFHANHGQKREYLPTAL